MISESMLADLSDPIAVNEFAAFPIAKTEEEALPLQKAQCRAILLFAHCKNACISCKVRGAGRSARAASNAPAIPSPRNQREAIAPAVSDRPRTSCRKPARQRTGNGQWNQHFDVVGGRLMAAVLRRSSLIDFAPPHLDSPRDRSTITQGHFFPDVVVWRSMIGFSPFSL